jgi:hypothetical protein
MSRYLQRLFDRGGALTAAAATPGPPAGVQPAGAAGSPLLAFDQRLAHPDLAADFGLLGLTPEWGEAESPAINGDVLSQPAPTSAQPVPIADAAAPAPQPQPRPMAAEPRAADVRPVGAPTRVEAPRPPGQPAPAAGHQPPLAPVQPRIPISAAVPEPEAQPAPPPPRVALAPPPPPMVQTVLTPLQPGLPEPRTSSTLVSTPLSDPSPASGPVARANSTADATLPSLRFDPPPAPLMPVAPAPPPPLAAPVPEGDTARIEQVVRETVRAELARLRPAGRPGAPAPANEDARRADPPPAPRPATAREASVIGDLEPSGGPLTLYGLRMR